MDEVLFLSTPLSIGQKVKIMRIVRLLTQMELAELVGVTQQDVSQLESNRPVRSEARYRILKILELDEEGGGA